MRCVIPEGAAEVKDPDRPNDVTAGRDSDVEQSNGAAFESHQGTAAVIDCPHLVVKVRSYAQMTVVEISGEVDASNAACINAHTRCFVATEGVLVVDLRGVQFFSLAGLRALYRLDDDHKQSPGAWTFLPSPAVSRLVRQSGADSDLPMAESFGR